jgi:8-oxo-dGTP diphosphatase
VGQRYLEPREWYASLPTVYVTAVVLLTDPSGERVLLVKPNYRPHWGLPGGTLDEGEAPHECAVREISEELGITIALGELLVIQWIPPAGDRPRPVINYLFDGGTLDGLGNVRLQEEELDDVRFFTWDEAATRLSADTRNRIPAARSARENGRTIYLPTAPIDGGR